jgi:hypothetical protein
VNIQKNSLIHPIRGGYPESFRIINSWATYDNGLDTIEGIDSYFGTVLPTFFGSEKEMFPFNIQIEYSKRQ